MEFERILPQIILLYIAQIRTNKINIRKILYLVAQEYLLELKYNNIKSLKLKYIHLV